MSKPDRRYSVLVLFGDGSRKSVAQPALFNEISEITARLLSLACPDLKSRGRIAVGDAGKNVAPRQGPWSPAMRQRYAEAMKRARFDNVELFDAAWEDSRQPDAYGSIRKLWDYEESGEPTERNRIGAESCVTVAVRDDFVDGALERLKAAAKSLITRMDCLYGSIETGVPWDQDTGGGVFEDMIDMRWHNRARKDFWSGQYRMRDGVPRLYRGNILSPSQFAQKDT